MYLSTQNLQGVIAPLQFVFTVPGNSCLWSRLYYCRESDASPCSGEMKLQVKIQRRGWLNPLHSWRKGGSGGGQWQWDTGLEFVSGILCWFAFCSQVPTLLEAGLRCCFCGVWVGKDYESNLQVNQDPFFTRITYDKSSLFFWISFSVDCNQSVNLCKTLLT